MSSRDYRPDRRDYSRRRSHSPDRHTGHRHRRYDDSGRYGDKGNSRHSSRQQSRSPDRSSRHRDRSRDRQELGSSRHRDRSRDWHRDRSRDRHERGSSRHSSGRDRSRSSSRHGPGRQSSPPSGRQQHAEPQEEPKAPSRWERMELEQDEDQQQPQQLKQQSQKQRHGADLRPSQHHRQQAEQPATGPSVAKPNPQDSKALVLQMMQAPASTASRPAATGSTVAAAATAAAAAAAASLTQQHTGKQLWSAKRDAAAAGVAPVFGANRWDLAEFQNQQEKAKFQRLLGAQKAAASAQPAAAAGGQHGLQPGPDEVAAGPRVLRKDEQQRVLSDVERQFVAGLRRADGRTVGLGL